MAKSKNKSAKNSVSDKSSNKKSETATNTRKIPTFTSADSTDLDNRERRDGPGGN